MHSYKKGNCLQLVCFFLINLINATTIFGWLCENLGLFSEMADPNLTFFLTTDSPPPMASLMWESHSGPRIRAVGPSYLQNFHLNHILINQVFQATPLTGIVKNLPVQAKVFPVCATNQNLGYVVPRTQGREVTLNCRVIRHKTYSSFQLTIFGWKEMEMHPFVQTQLACGQVL